MQRFMPETGASEKHLNSSHPSEKPSVAKIRSDSVPNGSSVGQKDDELNDIESILSLESQFPLKGEALNQQGKMVKIILIGLLSGCAAHYAKYEPVRQAPTFFNEDSISRYLLTQYKDVLNEQARVIYYRDNQLINDELVNGGINAVAVNGLQIVINCASKKCNRVVLAHNHPGQYFARASGTDLDNADKFKDMMQQANITAFYVITGEADVNWVN